MFTKMDWNGCRVGSMLAKFNACLSLTEPKTLEQLLEETGVVRKNFNYYGYMISLECDDYIISFYAEDDTERKTQLYKLNHARFKADGVLKDAIDEFVETRDNRQLAECLRILAKRQLVDVKVAEKILEEEVIPQDNIKYWGKADIGGYSSTDKESQSNPDPSLKGAK
jgi:hypothetical protein